MGHRGLALAPDTSEKQLPCEAESAPPGSPPAAPVPRGARRPRHLPSWLAERLSCLPLAKVLERPPPPARAGERVPQRTAPCGAGAPCGEPPAPAPGAAGAPPPRAAEAPGAPDRGGRLLPLNVGFARVELEELAHWPWHELRVTGRACPASEEGVVALLDHLAFVLDLAQLCTGFMLTYGLEELGEQQLDVVMRIICWSSEPGRQAKWQERCLCWKIVIPDGISFGLARSALSMCFLWTPPPCTMYLVADPAAELVSSDTVVCYSPSPSDRDTVDVAILNQLRQRFAQLAALLQFAEEDAHESPDGAAERGGSSASTAVPVGSGKEWDQKCGKERPQESLLPTSLDFGCVELRQGFNQTDGMGFMMIIGRDAEITDEVMPQVTGFLDKFVESPNAAKGFAMIYDLRRLRTPSMSIIMRLAEWGAEPTRQDKWQRLNLVCKVVVNYGVRYTLAKGVLSTFFFLCPPVCKTYLLWEPDQPEESSTVFEPNTPAVPPQDAPGAEAVGAEVQSPAPGALRGAAAGEARRPQDGARSPRPVAKQPPREDTDWMFLTAYDF